MLQHSIYSYEHHIIILFTLLLEINRTFKCLSLSYYYFTVSAGSAIPLVPGDNSHYVEGESRYIWMPDGDGKPHLVDLHEPADEEAIARNGANNQYWLYTR